MTEVRNPFEDPLRFERRVPECAIVIFGAAGDLAKRKLLPALYRLAYDRRLPASFAIIGNSRTAMSDDEYRQRMHDAVKQFSEDGAFDEDLPHAMTRRLGRDHGDVGVRRRDDLVEVDVEAVREHEHLALAEAALDLALEHVTLALVGQ